MRLRTDRLLPWS